MNETASDADADESNGTDDTSGDLSAPGGYERMTTYLLWGTVALLFALAAAATVGLYTSVGRAIDIWIAPDYRPLFRAAFNLAVVLACATGLSVLVGRLDTDRL